MPTFIPSLLDLQTNKANDSEVVHNTGDETIAGIKTFSSTIAGNISGTAAGGASPTGSASGDLSGTYPSPSVAQINGVSLGSTAATSGNVLIGSGTQWITRTIGGDGTLGNTGTLIVTKTNNVAFAASATTDTTNASNISSGTLGTSRLNGTYNSCTAGAANSIATTLTTGNADFYIPMVNMASSGIQVPFVTSTLFFHPSTGVFTAPSFSGTWGSAAALTKVDDTNVTLTLGGTPATALLQASSLTLGWTGTLAAARLNANVVQSVVNDTNVTGSISAQALTLGWTGTLSVARGGTGQSSYTDGQLLIGNTSGNTLTKSALTGTSNQVIVTNGNGSITLSLPQSIATTSIVTFGDGSSITGSTATNFTISSSGSGANEGGYLILKRNESTNGYSIIQYNTASSTEWDAGVYANSTNYLIRDKVNNITQFTMTQGSTNTSVATFAGKVTAGNDITANSGDVIVNTVGKTLKIKQGANSCAGTGAVMVAGAVTVNTTAVATGDIILIMKTAAGGTSTTGMPVITIVNGTSFTITGGSLDTSTWSWLILKAA